MKMMKRATAILLACLLIITSASYTGPFAGNVAMAQTPLRIGLGATGSETAYEGASYTITWNRIDEADYYEVSLRDITYDSENGDLIYDHEKVSRDKQKFKIWEGKLIAGHKYRIWVGAHRDGQGTDKYLGEYQDRKEFTCYEWVCDHSGGTRRREDETNYFPKNEKKHTRIVTGWYVCKDCGAEIRRFDDQEDEEHSYDSDGICEDCGYVREFEESYAIVKAGCDLYSKASLGDAFGILSKDAVVYATECEPGKRGDVYTVKFAHRGERETGYILASDLKLCKERDVRDELKDATVTYHDYALPDVYFVNDAVETPEPESTPQLGSASTPEWNPRPNVDDGSVSSDPIPPELTKLSNPVIHVNVDGTSVTVQWEPVAGAQNYVYSLRNLSDTSEDEEGKLLIDHDPTFSDHTITIDHLEGGMTYRVAIGAVPAGVNSYNDLCSWAYDSFTIDGQTPMPPITPEPVQSPTVEPPVVDRVDQSDILWAQQRLNALGYNAGTEDGEMGPKTKAALEAFQRDHGLIVNGQINEETMQALRDAPATTIPDTVALGTFLQRNYTMTVGNTLDVAVDVSARIGNLTQVTINVDGYTAEKERLSSMPIGGKDWNGVLTLNAGIPPLNVPGTYTIKLFASVDADVPTNWSELDQATLIVEAQEQAEPEPVPQPQPVPDESAQVLDIRLSADHVTPGTTVTATVTANAVTDVMDFYLLEPGMSPEDEKYDYTPYYTVDATGNRVFTFDIPCNLIGTYQLGFVALRADLEYEGRVNRQIVVEAQEQADPEPVPQPQPVPDQSDILWAQQRLNALGYNAGTEDGIIGQKTIAALEAFQRDHGLIVNGQINEETMQALRDAISDSGSTEEIGIYGDIAQDTYSMKQGETLNIDVSASSENADLVRTSIIIEEYPEYELDYEDLSGTNWNGSMTLDSSMNPLNRTGIFTLTLRVRVDYFDKDRNWKEVDHATLIIEAPDLPPESDNPPAFDDPTPQPQPVPDQSDILWAQQRLNALGYNAGTEDGIIGQKTIAALEAFQRDHGLIVNGQINEETMQALRDALPQLELVPDERAQVLDIRLSADHVTPGTTVTATVTANAVTSSMEFYLLLPGMSPGDDIHRNNAHYTEDGAAGNRVFTFDIPCDLTGTYQLGFTAVRADLDYVERVDRQIVVADPYQETAAVLSASASNSVMQPGLPVSVIITCNAATTALDVYTFNEQGERLDYQTLFDSADAGNGQRQYTYSPANLTTNGKYTLHFVALNQNITGGNNWSDDSVNQKDVALTVCDHALMEAKEVSRSAPQRYDTQQHRIDVTYQASCLCGANVAEPYTEPQYAPHDAREKKQIYGLPEHVEGKGHKYYYLCSCGEKIYPDDYAVSESCEECQKDKAMIKLAQEKLNERGYNAGEPDGLMGPNTKSALEAFQRDFGFPLTGELDALTYQALVYGENLVSGTKHYRSIAIDKPTIVIGQDVTIHWEHIEKADHYSVYVKFEGADKPLADWVECHEASYTIDDSYFFDKSHGSKYTIEVRAYYDPIETQYSLFADDDYIGCSHNGILDIDVHPHEYLVCKLCGDKLKLPTPVTNVPNCRHIDCLDNVELYMQDNLRVIERDVKYTYETFNTFFNNDRRKGIKKLAEGLAADAYNIIDGDSSSVFASLSQADYYLDTLVKQASDVSGGAGIALDLDDLEIMCDVFDLGEGVYNALIEDWAKGLPITEESLEQVLEEYKLKALGTTTKVVKFGKWIYECMVDYYNYTNAFEGSGMTMMNAAIKKLNPDDLADSQVIYYINQCKEKRGRMVYIFAKNANLADEARDKLFDAALSSPELKFAFEASTLFNDVAFNTTDVLESSQGTYWSVQKVDELYQKMQSDLLNFNVMHSRQQYSDCLGTYSLYLTYLISSYDDMLNLIENQKDSAVSILIGNGLTKKEKESIKSMRSLLENYSERIKHVLTTYTVDKILEELKEIEK